VQAFADAGLMEAPLGAEPHVRWLNGLGFPRSDWEDVIPPAQALSPDDAVYPDDLRRHVFFRRRGSKLTDDPSAGGFVRGDFDDLRQVVLEYAADSPDQADLRRLYGTSPVLSILVRAYSYLIARYDLDGLRIDTAVRLLAASGALREHNPRVRAQHRKAQPEGGAGDPHRRASEPGCGTCPTRR
jgi:hypothetical protein